MDKKTFILDDPTKFKRVKLEAGRHTVKRAPGPLHATIYAARDPTFQRYALEWIRKMKIHYPTDRVESPVSVASLEAFLDFLDSHSKNTFLSIAFFGHGYPGGFIFEGTQGFHTNTLDASFLRDDPESLAPPPGTATNAINSLKRRRISDKKAELIGSTIYMFACHSSEISGLKNEAGDYITVPSFASALSSYFSSSVYSVTETMYYLSEGFGFATEAVKSRSSEFFSPFQLDFIDSGGSQSKSSNDFFNTFP